MKKFLQKLFGGINLTWPKLIVFAVIMGIYTALMAMLVPDGNSFHDIAVTMEWWVLPAILIIVNCEKPLEAALKTFVFFLISQPLVYFIQVPFNGMGWGLFGYYPFWFKVTLLTFPAAFIGWYMKKDKWYSGVILSAMTSLLATTGIGYIFNTIEHFPNHLVSIIYCFITIPIFIIFIFKDKKPRITASVITIVIAIIYLFMAINSTAPYEIRNNTVFSENNITLVGERRPDIVARLCMVVDWCIDHPEYTAKIKVIPKKDYPVLMPCEFWGINIQAKRFELLRIHSSTEAVWA